MLSTLRNLKELKIRELSLFLINKFGFCLIISRINVIKAQHCFHAFHGREDEVNL